MCACTEPVRIGIGAGCVEYGRPKWPITMLNHTSLVLHNVCFFYVFAPCARTTRYEEDFFSLENQGKKEKRLASIARLITMRPSPKKQVRYRQFGGNRPLPQMVIYAYACTTSLFRMGLLPLSTPIPKIGLIRPRPEPSQ